MGILGNNAVKSTFISSGNFPREMAELNSFNFSSKTTTVPESCGKTDLLIFRSKVAFAPILAPRIPPPNAASLQSPSPNQSIPSGDQTA